MKMFIVRKTKFCYDFWRIKQRWVAYVYRSSVLHPHKNELENIMLTHWGRKTHICVCKLIIIGSDNGLSPGRRQTIIWTNAGIWLMWPLGTNFNEILIGIQAFLFEKKEIENVVWEMTEILSRPQCVNQAVSERTPTTTLVNILISYVVRLLCLCITVDTDDEQIRVIQDWMICFE